MGVGRRGHRCGERGLVGAHTSKTGEQRAMRNISRHRDHSWAVAKESRLVVLSIVLRRATAGDPLVLLAEEIKRSITGQPSNAVFPLGVRIRGKRLEPANDRFRTALSALEGNRGAVGGASLGEVLEWVHVAQVDGRASGDEKEHRCSEAGHCDCALESPDEKFLAEGAVD